MVYSIDILKLKIVETIAKFPNSFGRMLKSKSYDTNIIESLNHYLPKLQDPFYTVHTKIYWILNGLTEFPKCGNTRCNNTFLHHNVVSWKIGYRKNCCSLCAKDSDDRKRLYALTCKKNYGVSNISQSSQVKLKKKLKSLDRYGVENVAQAREVKDKTAKTNESRYGASTYLNSEIGIYLRKLTCLDKYGVDSFSKTSMHKEKTIATNRRRFGVDYPMQSSSFRKHALKRYLYNGMTFDSKPELAVYIWLCDHDIDFVYLPAIDLPYDYNGHLRVYLPDFIIDGSLVEIKGDHFFKEDGTMQNPYDHSQDDLYEAKHLCMSLNNVIIWQSTEYRKCIDYVEDAYGIGYLLSFKKS